MDAPVIEMRLTFAAKLRPSQWREGQSAGDFAISLA
jgi:hypothetical protein